MLLRLGHVPHFPFDLCGGEHAGFLSSSGAMQYLYVISKCFERLRKAMTPSANTIKSYLFTVFSSDKQGHIREAADVRNEKSMSPQCNSIFNRTSGAA
jgi:hypothetical protein